MTIDEMASALAAGVYANRPQPSATASTKITVYVLRIFLCTPATFGAFSGSPLVI
jgi:hypothetical protein